MGREGVMFFCHNSIITPPSPLIGQIELIPGGVMTPTYPLIDMPRDHNTDCVFVKIVARYAIFANTTFHQTLAISPHSPKTAL